MRKGIFYFFVFLLMPVAILGAKEGYLGVYHNDLSETMQKVIGVDHGVFIKDIVDDSPAEEAGILPEDIIITFDGKKVEDKDEFTELIKGEKPGKLVEITILRGGKELTLKAELGKKPKVNVDVDIDMRGFPFGKGAAPWEGTGAKMVLLIPIIAIVMSLLVPIMGFYFWYRVRVLKTKERMLAIEKGVDLPPEPVKPMKVATPLDTLRRGFICLGIGVALVITSLVIGIKTWLLGGGLILLFIGLALVIWCRIAISKEGR